MSRKFFAVFACLVVVTIVLSACGQSAPAATPTPTTVPTVVPTATAQPTEVHQQHRPVKATFVSWGWGMLPWAIDLNGENQECFSDLRINPRSCDGSSLEITAKNPLLVMRNGEILAQLKTDETITLAFDDQTNYQFYGTADRNYPFYGEWISNMFVWSDLTKKYPILLLPRQGDHDQFIDLSDGVTYDFPVNEDIFDYSVTSPTLGHLVCIMDEYCRFLP